MPALCPRKSDSTNFLVQPESGTRCVLSRLSLLRPRPTQPRDQKGGERRCLLPPTRWTPFSLGNLVVERLWRDSGCTSKFVESLFLGHSAGSSWVNEDWSSQSDGAQCPAAGLSCSRLDSGGGSGERDVPNQQWTCLLYTSPSPRDKRQSRMPSSA